MSNSINASKIFNKKNKNKSSTADSLDDRNLVSDGQDAIQSCDAQNVQLNQDSLALAELVKKQRVVHRQRSNANE